MKSYKEFVDSQDELKRMLVQYMVDNEISITGLGRKVGLTRPTVNKFIRTDNLIDFRTISRINNFLIQEGYIVDKKGKKK